MSDLLERLRRAIGDRYDIERELGAGGMATVYLAHDTKHRRKVALKVLRPDLAAVLGGERFLREIEIAAQIEHPHILTLIDSGDAEGILYYVMPYVKGESLRDRLSREGRLPIADAVRMMRDVADGLTEAHQHGLVHRDVKPDNVMISGNHAVVMDFGVAKAMSSATGPQQLTTAGIALGTPSYMSPEQASADPNIDHRTDVYALGVLGYELLAGRPPFLGASAQEILAAHLTQPPEPVSRHREDTPPVLEAVVMKCLEKRPDDRWQQTEEVVRHLDAIATPSGGVPSMSVSAATASRRPAKRSARRRELLAVVAVLVVAAVFAQQRRAAATRALVEQVQAAVDAGNLDEAHAILLASGRDIGDGAFDPIASVAGGTVTVEADPPGAVVESARGVGALDSTAEAVQLGAAPIRSRVVLAGEYRLSIVAEGHVPGVWTASVRPGDSLVLSPRLVPTAWGVDDMVIVTAGPVPGPLAPRYQGEEVPAFLIDRVEVSNGDFVEFVSDGGYRNPDLWPDSMMSRDGLVPRDVALAEMVDRTGLPGPRRWSGGRFPDGRGEHPVTGISWYEATAYAAWIGKSLPTVPQWWRAALGDRGSRFPWGNDVQTIDDRSNFGGIGTTPVGGFLFGSSPFGAMDMAGNVREWLAGSASDDRFPVVGGSWQTPTYMFDSPNVDAFAPWFESEEVGFRLVTPLPTR